MSGLLSSPKIPPPEEPATMPDEQDTAARRKRRVKRSTGGKESTRYTGGATMSGKEYTRGTLG